jgi:hypothetical protein
MDFAVFFVLFFTSTLLNTAKIANCSAINCSNRSISPGFDLVCENNTTKINFPSYGDFIVKSISYEAKKLQLIDPKNCIHGVFLNLDLSQTPFRYYYVVNNYTYLNCSARLPLSNAEVDCLSNSTHHIYTVETSSGTPEFCRAVKTVAIPFAYSPYLRGNNFGLALTWDSPERVDSEPGGSYFTILSKRGNKPQFKVSSIVIFVFVVMTLVIISIKLSRKMDEKRDMGQPECSKEMIQLLMLVP